MAEQQNSYRQIVKATSLFGGVEIFQIIVQVIRSKFIATLLGPNGMGIANLLLTSTDLISRFTNFGLSTSAVKNIAAANGTGNQIRIATVITVFRRLVWITGIIGTLIVLVLSPWLSQFAFGNREYTLAFIWISITLLLNQLSSGQKALLRGMRRVQYLVKANLAGSILGLIVTVPLYFFFGIDGIVPGIIIASVIALVLSWFFSHKVKIQPVTVDLNASVTEGKEMLTMGFLISLSSTLSLLTAYVIRIYIRSSSGTVGVEQVGLYNAGFALINTYVGLVFTAMTTDFYPRLSAVAHNNQTCKQVINEQAEVAILILAPIIMVFLVFINIIIITLYSQKFTVISEMMYWASLGILFKAASWSIAFILLAKGTSRLYFQNELVSKAYFLVLNLLGYHFMGLTGLGISFMVAYIIYLIQYFFLSKRRFEFAFQSAFIKVFSVQLLLAICCLTAIKLLKNPYSSLIGTCLIILSCWYSYRELDKRIELQAILSSYVSRLKRK